MEFEFLSAKFLEAMNDIGRYGLEKYKEESFQARRLRGDMSRGPLQRFQSESILMHCNEHCEAYLDGVKHDHFDTLKHQLAAAAFNLLMEFYMAGLEDEKHD